MNFSSKLLKNAVDEMSQLPGIGKRTALRLVLFLLNQPNLQTVKLSKSLVDLVEGINLCKNCHNISDLELCEICSNTKRDSNIICVVEDVRDVMAIESTGQFNGVYHVLGGKISPIDGIGPNQLVI
jgi:recombination protein RecR